MAISDVLTTLTARRDRFRELLAVKSVEVAADASLLQCLDALAAYFGVVVGDPEDPEDLYPRERLAANFITLTVPEIPKDTFTLEYGSIGSAELHTANSWYLYVTCNQGSSYSYYGQYFPEDSGNRIRVDAETGEIRVYWLGVPDCTYESRKDHTKESSILSFDGYHTPQYFKRPSGEGNYKLFIDGAEAQLEVYHLGKWITAPAEGLSAEYTGDYIRLIPDDLATHTAYWSSGDGVNSDEFIYMT